MRQLQFVAGIDAVDAGSWDALAGSRSPFLRHAFLQALEASGSVGGNSGWQPRHLLLRENGKLLAAMPCYAKNHSYGEYVFDWSWADAYARNNLAYYPKLLTAIPFTPATGPRLLVADGVDRRDALAAMPACPLTELEICCDLEHNVFNAAHTDPRVADALRQSHWFELQEWVTTGPGSVQRGRF